MKSIRFGLAALLCCSGPTQLFAEEATADPAAGKPDLVEAIKGGEAYLKFRYRYENVDQEPFADDARASTLRTLLGYTTQEYHNFSVVLEAENVTVIGNDLYNDTVHGVTNRPVVADPRGTEVNKAYLNYTGIDATVVRVGRQDHNLDNQRFIGTVGWRQNDQMYDSAAIINNALPDTTLVYSYVDNVNRIFGDDHPFGDLDTTTHVINASYDGFKVGKLTGYGYLIDLDDSAVAGLSSATYGLRFTGKTAVNEQATLLYTAEYARQSDHGDNPVSYDADYYTLELGAAIGGFTARAGIESLGSDNNETVSFQTPLATLHKFNGWADKFLTTPGAGLEDVYADLTYKVKADNSILNGTLLKVVYHDFSAESGGADYGTEWDLLVKKQFNKHYGVLFKYANYDSDGFATDTQKFWVMLTANF